MTETWWYCSQRQGMLIEDARSWRLRLADGAVELHQAGEAPVQLVAPGAADRVVVLDVAQSARRGRRSETVAILGDGRPLLVLSVADICSVSALDYADERASADLARGALSLGLALEAASDDEAEVVRAARLWRGPAQRTAFGETVLQSAVLVVAVFLIVLTTVVGPYSGVWRPGILVAAVLVAGLAVRRIMLRRRLRSVWAEPDPGPRTSVVLSAQAVAGVSGKRGVPRAFLQIGHDDVVSGLVHTECWVPGPGRAGVRRCLVTEYGYAFVDAAGVARLGVPLLWDLAEVRAACASAGVSVSTSTDHEAAAAPLQATGELVERIPRVSFTFMNGGEFGDGTALAVIVAPSVAAWIALVPSLEPAVAGEAVAFVSGGLSLLALAGFAWLSIDRRRQERLFWA